MNFRNFKSQKLKKIFRVDDELADSFLIFLCLILSGCSSIFQGWGTSLEHGITEGAKSDSLSYNLVTGARKGLTDPESRQAIDSLIRNLGDSTSAQIRSLRDSLLGYGTQIRIEALRESLVGKKAKEDLIGLKNSILDTSLQEYIATLLNVLNDSTKVAASNVRDSLVGDKTNILIKAILDTAMNDLQSRIKYQIDPEMKGNLNFVEANATWLIALIGFVTLVLCWYIWRQKEKYLRIAKVLTVQISRFPDDSGRESLKTNISENAKTVGIEDDLRELLHRQGI